MLLHVERFAVALEHSLAGQEGTDCVERGENRTGSFEALQTDQGVSTDAEIQPVVVAFAEQWFIMGRVVGHHRVKAEIFRHDVVTRRQFGGGLAAHVGRDELAADIPAVEAVDERTLEHPSVEQCAVVRGERGADFARDFRTGAVRQQHFKFEVDHVGAGGFRLFQRQLRTVERQIVVRVEKDQVIAGRGRDAGEAGGQNTAVLLVGHDPDPGILRGVFGQDFGGVVRRSVVDHDDLDFVQSLVLHAGKTARQVLRGVVNRNQDGNPGLGLCLRAHISSVAGCGAPSVVVRQLIVPAAQRSRDDPPAAASPRHQPGQHLVHFPVEGQEAFAVRRGGEIVVAM